MTTDKAKLLEYSITLGKAHFCRGESDSADKYLNDALQIARDIGDRNAELDCCLYLSDVYYDLGDFEKIDQHLESLKEVQGIALDKIENKSTKQEVDSYPVRLIKYIPTERLYSVL